VGASKHFPKAKKKKREKEDSSTGKRIKVELQKYS
jgi:hypothetical protein